MQPTRPTQQLIRRELENTSHNDKTTLAPFKKDVEAYAKNFSDVVENARDMITSKYFIHIPTVDGYMSNFVDNFDTSSNKFYDPKAVPRQGGYWIESYATKIAPPAVGGEIDILYQAKRGNSRPDVILQYKGSDIAWLDITSSASEGHIYEKNSDGWKSTPYVTEVTYQPLKVVDLNQVSIPDKSAKNIGNLLGAAAEAKEKHQKWEAAVLEKYGLWMGSLLDGATNYVKKSAVEHDKKMDLEDEEMDRFFSPDSPGNRFEKLAISFIQDKVKSKIEPEDLAAVIMYWSGMIARYEKRFGKQLPDIYHLPTKQKLGLSWVKDSSSADGEPIIKDWFPV